MYDFANPFVGHVILNSSLLLCFFVYMVVFTEMLLVPMLFLSNK